MADSAMKGGAFAHDNTVAPKTEKVLPLFSNKGKTAIVAGAGAGIGLAVAQALAESGANVAIWYHSNKKAIDRAKEIEQHYGVKCTSFPTLIATERLLILAYDLGKAYQVNVADPKLVQESVDEIVKEFNGRLDIFIANSGIPWTQGAMLDGEIDHYRKVVSTDLDGTFYCARAAGAHWRRQKKEGTDSNGKKLENYTYGSFVATASMSGHIVNVPQLQAAYNAAKAGIIQLGRTLEPLLALRVLH